MLHILFVILKIIGIVLAVLLGLFILILLLALFVPIRYKGEFRKETEPEITARVSWLLHIVSIPVICRNGTLSVKIRFFGITVKKRMKDEEELDSDEKEFFQDVEDAVNIGEAKLEEIEAKEVPISDTSTEKVNGSSDLDIQSKNHKIREEVEKISEEPRGGLIKIIFGKIKAFFLKILGIWKKIKNLKYTFRRLCGRIKKGIQKCRDTKEFLTDERTRAAFKQCVAQLKILIKKMFPKKIRGMLRFGTKDPALTGEILGGISIFYPVFMDNVKVYPDFEQGIFEGELFVKGRFCLITVLLVLWRLWRDKNIRYVYHKLKFS